MGQLEADGGGGGGKARKPPNRGFSSFGLKWEDSSAGPTGLTNIVLVYTYHTCAARVTVVVLSVCLSTTILQATRRLVSDIISFSATRA